MVSGQELQPLYARARSSRTGHEHGLFGDIPLTKDPLRRLVQYTRRQAPAWAIVVTCRIVGVELIAAAARPVTYLYLRKTWIKVAKPISPSSDPDIGGLDWGLNYAVRASFKSQAPGAPGPRETQLVGCTSIVWSN